MNPETRLGRIRPPLKPPRTVRRSPKRFALRIAVSVVSATLLCAMVTFIRDSNIKRFFLTTTNVHARAVQEHWDLTGALPPVQFRPQSLAGVAPLDYFADEETRYFATHASGPTIIGHTTLVQLYTAYSGRAVLFFDRGQTSVEWMNEGRLKVMLRHQTRAVEEALRKARAKTPILPD